MIKNLYLDIDDVLLDTSEYAIRWHNKPSPWGNPKTLGKRELHKSINMTWEECWYSLPVEYWSTIPTMPWFDEMMESAGKYFGKNIYLLTSPIPNGICSMGKQLWINKYLPEYSDRLIIAHKKQACVSSDGLLIDDSYHNETAFKDAGKSGNFFLFPARQNKHHGMMDFMYRNPKLVIHLMRELLEETFDN